MKPVHQRYGSDSSKLEFGDCLRACIASILELSLDDGPHFRWGANEDRPDTVQSCGGIASATRCSGGRLEGAHVTQHGPDGNGAGTANSAAGLDAEHSNRTGAPPAPSYWPAPQLVVSLHNR